MSYQLKVYHIENKVTKEIRKFTVDSDVAANYEHLSAKIRSIFPNLLNKDIEVFWIDNEGDLLTISSNEELVCAWDSLKSLNGSLKFYAKEKEKVQKPKKQQGEDYYFSRAFYPGFSRRCHQQRFPWREPQMFYRIPAFSSFFCNETKEEQSKKEGENQSNAGFPNVDENSIKETVGTLASCFGLDPEVAKCYFVTFCDDMKEAHSTKDETEHQEKNSSNDEEETNENEEGKQNQEKDDEESDEKSEEEEASENQKENEKDEKPTSASNSKPKEGNHEFQQELNNMVQHFSEQFGLPSDTQQNIQGGLNSLLQGMFNFQQPQSEQPGESDEPRKPDDFIFVDKTNQLSEEEIFQKRLNEALEKMLAMGFDNDGGWLSQLLITKDLSIDRVLEALNPST